MWRWTPESPQSQTHTQRRPHHTASGIMSQTLLITLTYPSGRNDADRSHVNSFFYWTSRPWYQPPCLDRNGGWTEKLGTVVLLQSQCSSVAAEVSELMRWTLWCLMETKSNKAKICCECDVPQYQANPHATYENPSVHCHNNASYV